MAESCIIVSYDVIQQHLCTLKLMGCIPSGPFVTSTMFEWQLEAHSKCCHHGSNFVGAAREILMMNTFLKQLQADQEVADFCSSQMIEWSFILEHAPHWWPMGVGHMKSENPSQESAMRSQAFFREAHNCSHTGGGFFELMAFSLTAE